MLKMACHESSIIICSTTGYFYIPIYAWFQIWLGDLFESNFNIDIIMSRDWKLHH